MTDSRGISTVRPGAILSRLFLVLALVGVLQFDTGRDGWTANPAAASEIAFISAILTAESQLLRGQLPQNDSPDFTLPAMVNPRPRDSWTVAIVPEQTAPPSPLAIDIFPPVRGPPVV